MKLIMSEQEYNEAIQKAEKRGYETGLDAQFIRDVADDRVKVVRCAMCKYYAKKPEIKTGCGICTAGGTFKNLITNEKFFCASGTKREE